MTDWLWNSLVGFVLGVIPTWAWIVLGGVAIGWAWKTFGWQGVLGGLAAIFTLGAYRQGWRDRDKRDPHENVDDGPDTWLAPSKPKRKPVRKPASGKPETWFERNTKP